MAVRIVIPARYASTRLPGKPLADIAGQPMIVRVATAARRARSDGVWVAADDERIVSAARRHGFDAVLTRGDHASGTDRIAEVAMRLHWDAADIVVFGGGIIPEDDIPELTSMGVAKVFTPGATTTEIVEWVNANVTAS